MWALKEFRNDAAERVFAMISLEQELSIQTTENGESENPAPSK
jgi:hypothetical protein